MRKALFIIAAGLASFMGLSTAAQAANGCGAGWHRNESGRCRPDHYYHPSNQPYGYYGYPPPEVRGYYGEPYYGSDDRYYWRERDYDRDWYER